MAEINFVDSIRSFIAIELSGEVKLVLKNIQKLLKSSGPSSVNWVDPEGIHLTLAFLGNIKPEKVEPILRVIQQSSQSVAPFSLRLNGLGAFPSLKRVRVIWIGLDGDLDILQSLQKKIESNLIPLGFPPENRAFQPHLTLARLRETASPLERQNLGETILNNKMELKAGFQVDSINLMKSQLTRSGAIYSCLGSVKLNPSCQ